MLLLENYRSNFLECRKCAGSMPEIKVLKAAITRGVRERKRERQRDRETDRQKERKEGGDRQEVAI